MRRTKLFLDGSVGRAGTSIDPMDCGAAADERFQSALGAGHSSSCCYQSLWNAGLTLFLKEMCHDATFFQVDGERTQVYRLADACGGGALSGTAEMAVKSCSVKGFLWP